MSPLSSQLVIVLRHASLASKAKFISVQFSFCQADGESGSTKMQITIQHSSHDGQSTTSLVGGSPRLKSGAS